MWDTGEHSSVDQVMQLLRSRFGNINQAERFRAELRTRKRNAGETLQHLYQDVCRLVVLAYPGPTSDLSNIVGRDAFLEALDNPDMRIRILEKEPKTLDEAFTMACRLEALHNSSIGVHKSTNNEDREKSNKRYLRTAGSDNVPMPAANNDVRELLTKMGAMQNSLQSYHSEVIRQRGEIDALTTSIRQ